MESKEWVWPAFIGLALGVGFALIGRCVQADEFKAINLDQVYLEYRQYFHGGRDPLITSNGLSNRELEKELNIGIDTRLLKFGYWNNIVHSTTDQDRDNHHGQFRLIGLESRLGIRISQHLDISYYHHSQHLLDTSYAHDDFPVRDGIELKIYLYSPKREDTLIP